jgi:iron(III) transport system ATP-binding protein
VRRLLAAAGATAVFVTHDQEEAFLIGDQVALMLDGRIAQIGSPADLYERPASRDVATFVGDANLLPARAEGHVARTPVGDVPLSAPAHGRVEVFVRPECVAACQGDEAIVERIEYYGHDAVIVTSTRGCPVRCRVMGRPAFDVGDRIGLQYVGEPSVAFAPDSAGAVATA